MATDHWKNEDERLAAENRRLRQRIDLLHKAGDEALKQRNEALEGLAVLRGKLAAATICKCAVDDGQH